MPLMQSEFRPNQPRYLTSSKLRQGYSIAIEYRKFELIYRYGINLLGKGILFFQVILSNVILLCNYQLIREWGDFDAIQIGGAFYGTIIWIFILEHGGMFFCRSKECIKSWKFIPCKDSEEKRFLSKFRKSCRPIAFGTKDVFRIKRLTVLKFIRAITRGTLRTVLIRPK